MSPRLVRGFVSKGEALGRSRGSLGTKIIGVCDAAGRLVDFLLEPAQAHELAPSLTLLRRLPEVPSWAIADMACDAAQFRSAAAPWVPFLSCLHAEIPRSRSRAQTISIVTAIRSNGAGRD